MSQYLWAAVTAAVAVWARLLLDPLLGDRMPFVTLFLAVLATAWFFGRGSALFALLIGTFGAAYFILEPRGTFAVAGTRHQFGLALFLCISLLCIALFDLSRRARDRAYAVAAGLTEHSLAVFDTADEAQRQAMASAADAAHTQDLLEAERAERRRVEDALEEQRELLRVAAGCMADGFITADAQGLITFLNAAAARLTGWAAKAASGRRLDETFVTLPEGPGTRPPAGGLVTRVLRERRAVRLPDHTVLVSRGGTERAVDGSVTPLWDRNGRLCMFVLVFRDVTAQRKTP
jgi:PAS domain S-box-containing protein